MTLSQREIAAFTIRAMVPRVRELVVSDEDFISRIGFNNQSLWTLSAIGSSFSREALSQAIRKLLSDSQPTNVTDVSGVQWELEVTQSDSGRRVEIGSGERRYYLPDHSAISPHVSERLASFQRVVDNHFIPKEAVDRWSGLLRARALTDDELTSYWGDIQASPQAQLQLLKEKLKSGKIAVADLVHADVGTYERLVGAYGGEQNIHSYCELGLRRHFASTIEWNRQKAIPYNLMLCSHSAVATELLKHGVTLTADELRSAGASSIDAVTKIGAIELGIHGLQSQPSLAQALGDLVDQLMTDDPLDESGRFALHSALFILVDGQLAKTRIFAGRPPFWRRLVALTQANLIERAARSVGLQLSGFIKWAQQALLEEFYLQSLIDLRDEPRWLPDYASANQMKMDAVGRLLAVSSANVELLAATPISGLNEQALVNAGAFPQSFLSGPLEGNVEPINEPPPEIVANIEERLTSEAIDSSSFISVVNSVLIFRLDEKYAELSAQAIRSVKHRLRTDGDLKLPALLAGLATLAAASRNKGLSHDLAVLNRMARRDEGVKSVQQELALGLIAAAAHKDINEWRHFVGQWLTELSFAVTDQGDAEYLRRVVRTLCGLEFGLWPYCSRAEAALSAVAYK